METMQLLANDTQAPNLGLLPRADASAVMAGYQARAEALRHTAETLVVSDIDDLAGMALARTTRLSLRAIRIEAEKQRLNMVEDMTKETRRINTAAREIKEAIEPLEARLLEQELFIDREKERLLTLRRSERLTELAPYLTGQPLADVGLMEPSVWAGFLADAKDLHALKVKREADAEAAALAEIERQAEERRAVEAENARLREEAAAAAAALEAEREAQRVAHRQRLEAEAAEQLRQAEIQRAAAAEALRLQAQAAEEERAAAAERQRIRDEALRIEREARDAEVQRIQAEAKAERDAAAAALAEERAKAEREAAAAAAALAAERAAAERAARIEREARQEADRQRQATEDAERRRVADALRAEAERRDAELLAARKAASAPDCERLLAFADEVRALGVPAMRTQDGQEAAAVVAAKCQTFGAWIEQQAHRL